MRSSLNRQRSNTEVLRSNCILPKSVLAWRNKKRLLHRSAHSSCLEAQDLEGSPRMEEVHGKFLSWLIARRSTSALYSQKIKLPVSTIKLSYSSRDWRLRPTLLTLVTNWQKYWSSSPLFESVKPKPWLNLHKHRMKIERKLFFFT